MSWADRAESWIGWDEKDEKRLASLRTWMVSVEEELLDVLVERATELDGFPRPLRNDRFTARLHALLEEWLSGLLAPARDVECQEQRRNLGYQLARLDLTYQDILLLEATAHRRLVMMVNRNVDGCTDQLSPTLGALSKTLTYDRGLVYAGFAALRDNEMEQALLDRFLTITGFSRTLYEGLAEIWEQESGGTRRT